MAVKKTDPNPASPLDEDIKKILSTVKRVPARSEYQNDRRLRVASDRPKSPTRSEDNTKKSSRKIGTIVLSIAAVLFLVIGVLLILKGLRKPSVRSSIKGIWSYDEVTVYTFDGESHGNLTLPLNTFEFSYIAEEGVLSIDFADESVEDREYSYTLSGDVLILTGADGVEYRFVRIE